jgi:hypothetical protein
MAFMHKQLVHSRRRELPVRESLPALLPVLADSCHARERQQQSGGRKISDGKIIAGGSRVSWMSQRQMRLGVTNIPSIQNLLPKFVKLIGTIHARQQDAMPLEDFRPAKRQPQLPATPVHQSLRNQLI